MLKSLGGAVNNTNVSGALILCQSGIPMILPSSGSIANNGALTGLTALAHAYANCYMSFPAGAIASGIPAAQTMYFVQMSSTTAGTIFNNVYTSGTPTVPGSPTPFVTTGTGAYTQTLNTYETAISVSLPANAMGINGELELFAALAMNNNANLKQFQWTLGGPPIYISSPSTNLSVALLTKCRNRGVANSQVVAGNAGNAGPDINSGSANSSTILSVDTTSTQTMLLQLKVPVASTDFILMESFSLKLFSSN
jgi:hypothetical protein